jgi:hypothetical protein
MANNRVSMNTEQQQQGDEPVNDKEEEKDNLFTYCEHNDASSRMVVH